MAGLLGHKVGMTQIFDEDGLVVPVTIVQAGPCYVTQIKTEQTDGYNSVQIAYDDVKEKSITKARKGVFEKAKVQPKRHLKEFAVAEGEELKIGDELKADLFQAGETVKISGISKGKGFQGTVKRYNFSGGQKTHGQSDRERAPGSLGQGSTPSRVFKGHKMAGRMGSDRITLKSVRVVRVDADNNLLFIQGSLPGAQNTLLEIRN